jgi:hypothetical protein
MSAGIDFVGWVSIPLEKSIHTSTVLALPPVKGKGFMLEHVLSTARRFLQDAQQKFSTESASAIEQVYNDIVDLSDFVETEFSAINENSKLDESGKQRARRGVIEQAGRKLEFIKSKRDYPARYKAIEKRLQESGVEEEKSVLKFLMEREVRDRLCTMTQAQIMSLFGKALSDGSNPLLTNAILNAPPGFELVSEENLKKMRRVRTKIISPEISAELETARGIFAIAEKIFTLFKNELDALRMKELPAALSMPETPEKRPFNF